jgi:hypothetical protein
MYNVVPEKSWGGMTKQKDRASWESLECNTVLKTGSNVECSAVHGLKFIDQWKKTRLDICQEDDNKHY